MRTTGSNTGFASGGVELVNSSIVFQFNFCAKNPL
jgi:hypothetical protein